MKDTRKVKSKKNTNKFGRLKKLPYICKGFETDND
jgi:hypothetical protein